MTLQLYLLRRHLVAIGFALAGLGLLVLPAITVQAVQKLGGAGIGAVLEYVPLVLIELVPYLAPIAFLLGVVATFGRLAADSEWTAVRMAGVHPLKTLVPGALIALAGIAGTYFVLATVSPEWKFRQRSFLRDSQVKKLQSLGMGRTQFWIGDLFVDANTGDGAGTFYDVILGIPAQMFAEAGEDAPEDAEVIVVVADAMLVQIEDRLLKLFLSNMRALSDDVEVVNQHPSFVRPLDELVSTSKKRRDRGGYMTSAQIRELLEVGILEPEREGDAPEPLSDKRRADLRYEVHFRIALSLSYVVFLLLGAATGLWLKSGTQLGAMTVAIGLAFLYYLLSMELGQKLSAIGLIGPEVAAWATDAIFLALGAMLARRALWR